MPYKFIENVSIADIAFEATGKTVEEMFESAALAVTNTMVKDLKSVKHKVKKKIIVEENNTELLLYKFLDELVFLKDSKKLLFSKFDIKIKDNKLNCIAYGEKLDMKKHELLVDVKAITMHKFSVKKNKVWKAFVVLDV